MNTSGQTIGKVGSLAEAVTKLQVESWKQAVNTDPLVRAF